MFTLKMYISVFSGTVEARIFKLGIYMNNELLYCGTEIKFQALRFNSSVYLSMLLSFQG